MGETWAVDLAEVGAVYQWQVLEVIMVLLGIAAWIAWHVIQLRQESEEYAEDIRDYGDPDAIRRALDERLA